MKLLFDQNLSRQLVTRLADIYPGSTHVALLGLERANDREIYDYAALHGFTIVSKDNDFHQLSLRYGPPPKVIRLNAGNCTTGMAHDQLRNHEADIQALDADPETAILVIGNGL